MGRGYPMRKGANRAATHPPSSAPRQAEAAARPLSSASGRREPTHALHRPHPAGGGRRRPPPRAQAAGDRPPPPKNASGRACPARNPLRSGRAASAGKTGMHGCPSMALPAARLLTPGNVQSAAVGRLGSPLRLPLRLGWPSAAHHGGSSRTGPRGRTERAKPSGRSGAGLADSKAVLAVLRSLCRDGLEPFSPPSIWRARQFRKKPDECPANVPRQGRPIRRHNRSFDVSLTPDGQEGFRRYRARSGLEPGIARRMPVNTPEQGQWTRRLTNRSPFPCPWTT